MEPDLVYQPGTTAFYDDGHSGKPQEFVVSAITERRRSGWAGQANRPFSQQDTIVTNPADRRKARANKDAGLQVIDKFGPIQAERPRAVYDTRQLQYSSHNNLIPDEYGITRQGVMPMQEIISTNGGQHSGRTGAW